MDTVTESANDINYNDIQNMLNNAVWNDESNTVTFEKSNHNNKDLDNLLVYGYLRKCLEMISMSIPNEIFSEIFRIYPKLIHFVKFPMKKYNISVKYNKFVNTGCQIDLLQNGQRLMNDGNLKDAILSFEAYVQHCKDKYQLSKAWEYLGIAQAENENTGLAIPCFKESYTCNPYNLDVLLPLSVSFCNEIDTNNALNAMKEWIANHPYYMELIDKQHDENKDGWSLSTNLIGETDLDLYLKALKINGSDPDLNFIMGVLYNLTSEFDIAANYFKTALKSKPNDANLWNKLGATQANGGKTEDAIDSYKKALEIKPNYVRVLANLGIAKAHLNHHNEACVYYLKCLTLNKDASSVWSHLNMSLMQLNRDDLTELIKQRDTKHFKDHFDF